MKLLYAGYEDWNDKEILAGMIFGEARGEPLEGKIGVAITAMTRTKYPQWGSTIRNVVLALKQFSCWEDVNAEKIRQARSQNSIVWKICFDIADKVMTGVYTDTIGEPTNYHTTAIFPDWATSMKRLAVIGNHIFYHDPSVDKKAKNAKKTA